MKSRLLLYYLCTFILGAFSPISYAGVTELDAILDKSNIGDGSILQVADPTYQEEIANPGNYVVTRTSIVRLLYSRDELSDVEANGYWTYQISYKILPSASNMAIETGTLAISFDLNNNVYQSYLTHDLSSANVTLEVLSVVATYSTDGITYNNVSNPQISSLIPDDIRLELVMKTERNTILDDVTDLPYLYFNGVSNIFSWAYIEGAEEYDIEWTFLDYEDNPPSTVWDDPGNIFDYKAGVRVRVSSNSYEMDVSYPQGLLYFRVRGVGRFIQGVGTNYTHVNTSDWHYETANLDVFGSLIHTIGVSNAFELNKNWQHASGYAEDGKYKSIVSFYDGTLRNRQSQTNLSSEGVTLVDETKYDSEGRGVVKILPTPKFGTSLNYDYISSFNKTSDNSGPFTKADFEEGTSDQLGDGGGSGQYFSASNLFTNDPYRDYIPDGAGYSYTQIAYKSDNTGRVAKASGLGPDFKLGSGKETEFFYGAANSTELHRMFGTSVGKASHYNKNSSIDANGQMAISYHDQEGRVIATCFSGTNPDNLVQLSSNVLEFITVSLNDNNVLDKDNGQYTSTSSIVNVVPGTSYDFNYDMSGVIYSSTSNPPSVICADCVYDLEITMTDPDGYILQLNDAGVYKDVLTRQFSNPNNPNCANNQFSTTPFTFTPVDPIDNSGTLGKIGTYTITKTLTLNTSSLESAIQGAIVVAIANGDFPSLTQLENTAVGAIDFDDCEVACYGACRTSVLATNPTWDPSSISWDETDHTVDINVAIFECITSNTDCSALLDDVVNGLAANGCDEILDQMLRDVSPPVLGQDGFHYLESTAATNGFWSRVQAHITANTINLLDASGNDEDDITDIANPANFREEWASQLILAHREYCHYTICLAHQPSRTYNIQISMVNDWTAAASSGYLNPLGLISSIFPYPPEVLFKNPVSGGTINLALTMPIVVGNDDPVLALGSIISDQIESKMLNYFDGLLSDGDRIYNIWEFVDELNNPGLYANIPAGQILLRKWQIFRGIYIQIKEEVLNTITLSAPCQYYNDANGIVIAPLVGAGSGQFNQILAEYVAGVELECSDICENNAALWISSILETCTLTASEATSVETALYNFCVDFCGVDNPFGIITAQEITEAISYTATDGSKLDQLEDIIQLLQGYNSSCALSSILSTNTNCTEICDDNIASWLSLIQETCTLSTSQATSIETLLTSYCIDYCGLSNPFGIITDQQITDALAYGVVDGTQLGKLYEIISQLQSFNSVCGLSELGDYAVNQGTCNNVSDTYVVIQECFPQIVNFFNEVIFPELQATGSFNFDRNFFFSNYPTVDMSCLESIFVPQTHIRAQASGQHIIIYPAAILSSRFRDEAGVTVPLLNIDEILDFVVELTNPDVVPPPNNYSYVKVTLRLVGGSVITAYTHSANNPLNACSSNPWHVPVCSFTIDECFPIDVITPVLTAFEFDCAAQLTAEAEYNAGQIYDDIISEFTANFTQEHFEKCFTDDPDENLYYTFQENEYHYTLYYYDQAGNLTQTVPPDGVNLLSMTAFTNGVYDGTTEPNHTFLTEYEYNSLNAVTDQSSPDGGASTLFYDLQGRLMASQNAEQLATTVLDNTSIPYKPFSYTRYDGEGRIIEYGELLVKESESLVILSESDKETVLNSANFPANITGVWTLHPDIPKREVTKNFYDIPLNTTVSDEFGSDGQEHLRNRVASSTLEQVDDGDDQTYDNASHYSYDPHGNVKTLLQEVPSQIFAGGYKRIDYNYDLVSGNVNEVAYQKGELDQFYHKYCYDADNRIIAAFTSEDHIRWEQDAKYFYHKHGPLARRELGHDKVQGSDNAYTIHGWLKGVNSNTLVATRDIGNDAEVDLLNNQNYLIGSDAFGFTLGYYEGDFAAIGTIVDFFAASSTNLAFNPTFNLFNGNISHMVTAIQKPDETQLAILGYNYSYDQLNRIKSMDAFEQATIVASNSWTGAVNNLEYQVSNLDYDGNGNIQSLSRSGTGVGNITFDDFDYQYQTLTNKLTQVIDNSTSSLDGTVNDITSQPANNYVYNAIGNLVKDDQEDIFTIEWTVYGKVKRVTREAGSLQPDLEFVYDPNGNRIMKIVKPRTATGPSQAPDWTAIHYVLDPNGNPVSTYELNYEFTETLSGIGAHADFDVISGNVGDNLDIKADGISVTNGILVPWNTNATTTRDDFIALVAAEVTTPDYLAFPEGTDGVQIYASAFLGAGGNGIVLTQDGNIQITSGPIVFAEGVSGGDYYQEETKLVDHIMYGSSRFGVKQENKVISETDFNATIDGVSNEFIGGGAATTTAVASICGTASVSAFGIVELVGPAITYFPLDVQVFVNGVAIHAPIKWNTQPGTVAGLIAAVNSFVSTPNYLARINPSVDNQVIIEAQNQGSGENGLQITANPSPNYTISQIQEMQGGVDATPPCSRILGTKHYELSNHLGNVLATVSDLKLAVDDNTYDPISGALTASVPDGIVDYYTADVLSSTDYYPFGMAMSDRSFFSNSYRYGFNGQEKDDELKSNGNSYDFSGRSGYDPRIGRFITIDPRTHEFSFMSPYSYAANNPVFFIDESGLGPLIPESWWAGKSYSHGFVAGFINEGTEQVIGFSGFAFYMPMTLIAEVQGGSFENYAQYGPWGWMAYDWVQPKFEVIDAVGVMMQSEEARTLFVAEIKGLMTEWGEDVSFFNGSAKAGYAHGQAFFIALEIVVGTKGVRNFLKTGKLGLDAKQLKLLKRTFICGCFAKGTEVYTEEGTKNIEDVKIGDLVWAFDEKDNNYVLKEVTDTSSRMRNHVYKISFGNEIIEATNDHPLFVGGRWVNVIDLNIGDSLTLYGQSKVEISNIEYVEDGIRVYNFVVQDFHSYFVSSKKVLVHNGSPCSVSFQSKSGIFGGDWISKKIHADVISGSGKNLGEVSFRLSSDGKSIVAKSVFNNGNVELVEELGMEFISNPGNRKKLLALAKDALSAKNTSAADKIELNKMIEILGAVK